MNIPFQKWTKYVLAVMKRQQLKYPNVVSPLSGPVSSVAVGITSN